MRQVGAQYHAAAEGLSAAEEIFEVLETEPRAGRYGASVPGARSRLELDGVTVRHAGRGRGLAGRGLAGGGARRDGGAGRPERGREVDAAGCAARASSSRPTGRVRVGGARPGRRCDLERWREQIAWVPQRPHLFAGTIAENVRLARPDADDAAVRAALRDAGAYDFVAGLPQGVDTPLGEDGAGLSAGQRQRLALARAFLADRPLLLLDEPTAALDGETEAGVVDAVRRLAAGRTVLLVVHRPALLAVADRVVTLGAAAARLIRRGPPVGSRRAAVRAAVGSGRTRAAAARRGRRGQRRRGRDAAAARGRAARGPRSRLARVRAAGRRAAGAARARPAARAASRSAAAVGLMAVSGWLISRASEQPPVLYLMVAVTATRAFGIGRAVFRYAERLVSHDAVLRMLADLRVAVYRAAGAHRARRAAQHPARGSAVPARRRRGRAAGLLAALAAARRRRGRRRARRPSASPAGCCPRPGPCSPSDCSLAGVGRAAGQRRLRPPCRAPTRARARRRWPPGSSICSPGPPN